MLRTRTLTFDVSVPLAELEVVVVAVPEGRDVVVVSPEAGCVVAAGLEVAGAGAGALVVAGAEDSVCSAAVFSSLDPPSLDPPSEAAPRPMNTIANAINTMAIARSGGPDGCSFGVLTMSTLSPVRGQPDHMYA